MPQNLEQLRGTVRRYYLRGETETLSECLRRADAGDAVRQRIGRRAYDIVAALRKEAASQQGLDAFLSEYDLSSEEGVVLMCLAESLLRIPDNETADRLIRGEEYDGE